MSATVSYLIVTLSLFYRICVSAGYSVGQLFLQLFSAGRPARHNLAMHPFTLVYHRCHIPALAYVYSCFCFVRKYA